MRRFFVTASVLVAAMVFATSVPALEKRSALLTAERADGWNASLTSTIAYYNICTGWVWVWSGWDGGDQVRVTFSGGGSGVLLNTSLPVVAGFQLALLRFFRGILPERPLPQRLRL